MDKFALVGFVTTLPTRLVPRHTVPALLLAALVAYACGPRPAVSEAHARKPLAGSKSLTSSLAVNLDQGVTLAFQVTNEEARKVEVSFPSGLTHDFEIQDTLGRVVWRWSEGRLFTQAMQNRVLASTEALAYKANWEPENHHGEYVAVVSLKSSSHPIERRVKFTLP